MKRFLTQCLLFLCASLASNAASAELVNGNFEAGLTGWSRADQIGSDGAFFLQTGTASPVNGTTVPAPSSGLFAAMSEANGPGSHVLYQDFVQTTAVSVAFLAFDLYINNSAGAFTVQDHLDFATPALNQQARVDIVLAGADPFSLAVGDVLLNAYRTQAGDAADTGGYIGVMVDVTALLNANLNTALRLRFAEVDNVAPFLFGVDNVRLIVRDAVDVPEPGTLLLCIGALFGLACARRRC